MKFKGEYIFHGTNATLLDNGLVAGTYFTTDLEIAEKYGNTIYAFELNLENKDIFKVDWEGYYISRCFIPLEHFKVFAVVDTNGLSSTF